MSGERSSGPFLFIGNHPCLDFINTAYRVNGRPVDALDTFSDVVRWMIEARLLGREDAASREWTDLTPSVAHRMLEQVRHFRAVLRDMVERMTQGKPPSPSALAAVNERLRYRIGCSELLSRGGRIVREFRPESRKPNQLLGVLAEAAGDLLCDGDPALVKRCQNPVCVLYFYDSTKNHARHWCSMRLCGNRTKVAAHYRRHRHKRV